MAGGEKDRLTGLSGKEAFLAAIAQQATNGADGGPTSVAVFDIDSFLELNEAHGHDAGDVVLAQVGELLRGRLPRGAAYRTGGDEFAVVMERTEKEAAFLLMESIRKEFHELEPLARLQPRPSFSAGVATHPDDGTTRQEVLRKADDALYRAKTGGRNRVAIAREERKIPKTSHYTQGQLERLSALSQKEGVGEAELLREALDDLLKKYSS